MLKYKLKQDSVTKSLDFFDKEDNFLGNAYYLFYTDSFFYNIYKEITLEELEEIAKVILKVFNIKILK